MRAAERLLTRVQRDIMTQGRPFYQSTLASVLYIKKAYPIGIRLSIIISKPDQLFTPPSATPAMIYLDNRKYTTISGRTVSVSPRYIEPNSVL